MLGAEVHMTHRTRPNVRAAAAAPLRPVLAFALILLLAAGLGAAPAQEAPLPDQVTVRGEGTVHGTPDEAVLELGVEAVDADARTVIDRTSAAMTSLQEALSLHGVDERDVRTTVFDLYREEPRDEEGAPLPARYRLVHLVQVTLRDIDAVGDVLASAVEAGADRVGGIRFRIADVSELEDQARRAAVADARETAETLAEAAGRSLGPALRIGEIDEPPRPTGGFESRAMALDSAAPVATGQLAVTVTVSMVYALE